VIFAQSHTRAATVLVYEFDTPDWAPRTENLLGFGNRNSSRGWLQRGYFLNFVRKFAFGVPRIIGALHPNPGPRSVTKEFAKMNGYGRGNGFSLLKNIVKVLARNSEEGCDLGLCFAGRGDYVHAQQFARMGRAPVRTALGCILDHSSASQWYCSKSTRRASPASNSKVIRMHLGASVFRTSLSRRFFKDAL
jgi:hypothetical protein